MVTCRVLNCIIPTDVSVRIQVKTKTLDADFKVDTQDVDDWCINTIFLLFFFIPHLA